LRLNGNYSEAQFNLGNMYFYSGKLEDAAKCFKVVIEINPLDEEAYNNLGVVYETCGEIELAIEYYQISAKLGYEPAKNVLKYYCRSW
jgi:tetratricopeptide (TPR) repeat protein